MLRLQLQVTGATTDDLVIALEEATRLARQGYLRGQNRNEAGSYVFDVAGSEELCLTAEGA